MWGIDRSGAGGHDTADIGKTADAEGGAFDHSAAVVPVTSKDPSWGSANAPVTLVEYSDFQ